MSSDISLTAADIGARPDTWMPTPGEIGAATVAVYTATLTAAGWSQTAPYTQTVSIEGVTAASKVDLQPTPEQLTQMITDGVTALLIANNNGTLTAYALGATPTTEMVMQCTVTEVGEE